jgi:putative transcriptional regulator
VLFAYDSRVREARLNAGLSQEALAREVGVSRQTIVNIERGESEPKVLLAIAIAVALGLGAAAVSELFRKGRT